MAELVSCSLNSVGLVFLGFFLSWVFLTVKAQIPLQQIKIHWQWALSLLIVFHRNLKNWLWNLRLKKQSNQTKQHCSTWMFWLQTPFIAQS